MRCGARDRSHCRAPNEVHSSAYVLLQCRAFSRPRGFCAFRYCKVCGSASGSRRVTIRSVCVSAIASRGVRRWACALIAIEVRMGSGTQHRRLLVRARCPASLSPSGCKDRVPTPTNQALPRVRYREHLRNATRTAPSPRAWHQAAGQWHRPASIGTDTSKCRFWVHMGPTRIRWLGSTWNSSQRRLWPAV